ncbi:MAG: acetate/propionate family kinase [Acidimicrobiaceae bacterium]|nr:acetate/propionate family kinase [Acidimicrobiaceae bacterium]
MSERWASATTDPAGQVLVVDAGSHSIRLALVGPHGDVLAAKRVDAPPEEAAGAVPGFLAESAGGREGTTGPVVVGHRLVHGGEEITQPVVVDDAVRDAAERTGVLAPLHNPPALVALDLVRRSLPDVPHVICPDTAFHAGLPRGAATYPLPWEWIERYGLRRYGFHGLSYAWALRRAAELLGSRSTQLQMVLVHLGGGCSACAVREGRSVDTTMGFTPLEGLAMTTRSGSVDPGLLLWLQNQHGLSPEALADALNSHSGLLGLSGSSADTRDLVAARAAGDDRAALALEVFNHRVRAAIAAMAASLDRLDAVVFTGEIGGDQPEVRQEVCAGLGVLGVPTTIASGPAAEEEGDQVLSPEGASPAVVVVQTGEVLEIAAQTRAALRRLGRRGWDEPGHRAVDPVDQDGFDSFPASDPPAHWAAASR